jgi:SH3 domain protein
MMSAKYLIAALLFAHSLAHAESFVYVTDQVDIPMRADKVFGNNIVRSLSSGTKLAILQATEDGWTQVKFEESEGWIISRYLSNNPPARTQLEDLRQTYNANKLLLVQLSERKNKLEFEAKSLKTKNKKLNVEISKLNAEKQHVEKVYQDALQLEHINEKLTTANLQLKTQIQLLKSNDTVAQDSSSRNWFIAGSFVLFIGILIGFIFPNFVNRRRL